MLDGSPVIENDRAAAHAAVIADDGRGLGIVFRDRRTVTSAAASPKATLEEIEMQFTVCDRQAISAEEILDGCFAS